MSDDTVRRAFAVLELTPSADPPPGFSDALFRSLLAEVDTEREPSGALPKQLRSRRRLRRLLPLAAALVALSLFATIVLVGSRPETALAVVRQAQSALSDAPAFQATIAYDLDPERPAGGLPQGARATLRVSYGGPTSYRQDVLNEEPAVAAAGLPSVGSFIVWDGQRLGFYRATENRFVTVASPFGFEPLMQFSWDTPYPDWEDICARGDAEVLPDAEIAGRATRHISCRDAEGHSWELWADRETGLVLKVDGALGNDDVHPFATTAGGGFEVTSIDYEPAFAPDTFAVTSPPGAIDLGTADAPPESGTSDRDAGVRLILGEVAPDWNGTLLSGEPVGSRELRGRPVLVLLFADWCPAGDPACDVLAQFQQAYETWSDRVAFVAVDVQGSPSGARRLMDATGSTFPVTVDATAPQTWGVDAVPTWVVLDAQGRTSDIRFGPQTVDQLDELLGRAVP